MSCELRFFGGAAAGHACRRGRGRRILDPYIHTLQTTSIVYPSIYSSIRYLVDPGPPLQSPIHTQVNASEAPGLPRSGQRKCQHVQNIDFHMVFNEWGESYPVLFVVKNHSLAEQLCDMALLRHTCLLHLVLTAAKLPQKSPTSFVFLVSILL